MKNARTLLLVVTLLAAFGAGPLCAFHPIDDGEQSLALDGFDAVAYFEEGAAVEGSPYFSVRWKSVDWRFSTRERMERFLERPEAYAPQFGGYCAQAMANGALASCDPTAFVIHEGKLYLMRDVAAAEQARQHPERCIKQARMFWDSLGEPDMAMAARSQSPEEAETEQQLATP